MAEDHDAEIEVVLGEGMIFEGLLVLPRASRIDGRVRGDVLALGPVRVGESGVVEADLEAERVAVDGRVEGNLRAHRAIELGPAAVVLGDLEAPTLEMAEGARVDGRCLCGVDARRASTASPSGSPPDPAG